MVAINNFFLRQSAADTHTRFETTNEQRRGAARGGRGAHTRT
jgi:hypothetical protein